MNVLHRKALVLILFTGLGLTLFHIWSKVVISEEITLRKQDKANLLKWITQDNDVANYGTGYHLKEAVACQVSQNVCTCVGDKGGLQIPFSNLLFPRLSAHNFEKAFLESHPDPESLKRHRAQEYSSFQKRSHTAANVLMVAEANSPLQYPIQGVEVRPLKTIIIPGLALKRDETASNYMVYLKATLGTFNIAAIVDDVSLKGEGEKHIILSSLRLCALNQQLRFITYTSTVFHPRTADIVQFGTEGHQSLFTIKIGHKGVPKLYNSGSQAEYNISALVTIATKTFLRYDKLTDLIVSIRRFYPTVTIVIADDNQHPQPVTGPYIEQYVMPYKKGWFAGRNLAVSQVTTKYVLWVDDDFYFTAATKLEKMVDVLEKTTLDLVGGAVREVTGYTATYRHTISVEDGDEQGDCIHVRQGHHHDLHGFPNCVVADAVINFFMGRTEKLQEVGFNPRLARHAHLEFFIDGLGILHIGSCSDVIVNHASKIKLPWTETESEKSYAKFRYSSSSQDDLLYQEVFYFHNRFKCITSK